MAKYALITGASSGIGRATAFALGKKGYDLVIASRSLEKLEAVKKEVEANPLTVTPLALPCAPGSAGHVKLHGVPDKEAAMIMAIVADKMQTPLNELRFISIKEVK